MEHDELADRKCGTPLVMAPEVMQNKDYGYKRDVWALGAIFYQLLTGDYVFGHEYIAIPKLEENAEAGEYAISRKLTFSLQGLEFTNRCLDHNEYTRMSVEEMSDHPYLTMESQEYIDFNKIDQGK